MATLLQIVNAIQRILDDPAYTDEMVVDQINASVTSIAAGIRMPDDQISPPLPDLYAYDSVNTSITLPYVSLPITYQRQVFKVYDDSMNVILPPKGGDYYAFARFMQQVNNLNLAETGTIYLVCIKGSKLYYQGIPSVATFIGLHFYRKPVAMALDDDTPDGIPEHLQIDLLKHHVLKTIFGERIEDGQDNSGVGVKYHTGQFYECMQNLTDFIGIDAGPQYYGSGDFEDRGRCDG